MLAEANKHFAAIRSASERGEINWLDARTEEDGARAYQGLCPGYIILVIQATSEGRVITDGAITTTGMFSVIHLTPEMALFCFNAAAEKKS